MGNLKKIKELKKFLAEYSQEIRDMSLDAFTQITELDLSYLEEISVLPDAIGELKNLERLYLVDASIRTLPDTIGNLENLTDLNLGNTEISALPDTIGGLKNLIRLDLPYTKIRSLPDTIGNLKNLTYLDLKYSQIRSLPDTIGNLENLTDLDLGNTEISALPDTIGGLKNLIRLDLKYSQISALPDTIGGLKNLIRLDLEYSQISALPDTIGNLKNLEDLDLEYSQISALPDTIGGLKNLIRLDLKYSQISALPDAIGNLKNLKGLDLEYSQISALPDTIGNLKNLKGLYLSGTEISALPDAIGNLKNLSHLYLSHTKISALPDTIGKLKNLKYLYLDHAQISVLPDVIGNLKYLEHIDLSDTKISSLPLSLIERKPKFVSMGNRDRESFQGLIVSIYGALPEYDHTILTSSPEAAYRYLTEKERVTLREVKVGFLGAGDAGKTSLTHLLVKGEPIENPSTTNGVEISDTEISVGEEQYTLHFWDFGGQKTYHPLHTLFLSRQAIYIIVLNGRNDEVPDEWLGYLKTFAPNAPVILVINKIDECPRADINSAWYTRQNDNIFNKVFKLSCKYPKEGIDQADDIKDAIKRIIENDPSKFRVEWPRRWDDVKQTIVKEYEKGCDFLTEDQFSEICAASGIAPSEEGTRDIILEVLNDLGIALSFRDGTRPMPHVLNPDWICHGIYKILDAQINLSGVVFPYTEFERAVKAKVDGKPDPRFQKKEDVSNLLGILKSRDLCAEIPTGSPGKPSDPQIFMQAVLPVEKPADVPCTDGWITYVFQFEFLLPAILSQFTASRIHDILSGNLRDTRSPDSHAIAWRHGAVLHYHIRESGATVRAVVEEGSKAIWLHLDPDCGSTADRRECLRSLRETLYDILQSQDISFEGVTERVKINLSTPMPISNSSPAENPAPMADTDNLEEHTAQSHGRSRPSCEYLNYATLLRLYREGDKEYRLPESCEKITVATELCKYWDIGQKDKELTQERNEGVGSEMDNKRIKIEADTVIFADHPNESILTAIASGNGKASINTTTVSTELNLDFSKLPEQMNAVTYGKLIALFEQFLAAEKADELPDQDKADFTDIVGEAKEADERKKGLDKIRDFFATGAHMSTVANGIVTFAQNLPWAADFLKTLFS